MTCGTACPATCCNPKPQICTKQCVQGCFCKPGFVRDDKKICIPEDKCPKSKYIKIFITLKIFN